MMMSAMKKMFLCAVVLALFAGTAWAGPVVLKYATFEPPKSFAQTVIWNPIWDALNKEGDIWISANLSGNGELANEVEIMISDNGPGIPLEIRSKIFDPFFTTKDVGHGSGLGLYIVHDIITSLNGSINIDSRSGEGTTFVIWLPGTGGKE